MHCEIMIAPIRCLCIRKKGNPCFAVQMVEADRPALVTGRATWNLTLQAIDICKHCVSRPLDLDNIASNRNRNKMEIIGNALGKFL